ncbi:MAG: polysaccharide lyase [Draconibacterium sp.]
MSIQKIHFTTFFVLLLFLVAGCVSHGDQKNENESVFIDFEKDEVGKYSEKQLKKEWTGTHILCGKQDYVFYKLGITPYPLSVGEEDNNKYMSVLIDKGRFGPVVGAQWSTPLVPSNSFYLTYRLKFAEGFDFRRGGKLPGLAGGKGNSGGNVPNGSDGWSARMMFWENGKLSFYLYYPDQPGKFGDPLVWKYPNGEVVQAEAGKWYTLKQYIQMNDPGKKNGIVRGWLDGKLVCETDTIRFRDIETLNIDQVFFSVFMGGDDSTWAPEKDQYVYFDDFEASNPSKKQ